MKLLAFSGISGSCFWLYSCRETLYALPVRVSWCEIFCSLVKYSSVWPKSGKAVFLWHLSDLTSKSDNLCQGSDFLFLSWPWCHPSLFSRTASFPISPYTCSQKWPCDTTLSNCIWKKLCWRFGARVSFSEWGHSDSGTLSLTASLEFWCDAWIWAAILQPWGTRPKRKTKRRAKHRLCCIWAGELVVIVACLQPSFGKKTYSGWVSVRWAFSYCPRKAFLMTIASRILVKITFSHRP